MKNQKLSLCCLTFLLLVGVAIFAHGGSVQIDKESRKPDIPKTWVDAEMGELEIPLADPVGSPKHISAEYYYKIPIRKIYKSYPIYAPGNEPPGYLDWLKRQEPEIVFDASNLKTEADWIKAGEIVFHAPVAFLVVTPDYQTRNPKWYEKIGTLLTKDGVYPYDQYFVREKGKVERGFRSCASCHTRVMPDGTILKGAQGNPSFDRDFAFEMEQGGSAEVGRIVQRFLFAAPWVKPDPQANLAQWALAEITGKHNAIVPGVLARHRTSPDIPVQIPDLIGIKERKYLDRTGLQLHRGIVDMMRYAALNQGADDLASFAGFIPAGKNHDTLPDPAQFTRYSDEQLYALALYLYSLKPPPNPNKFDALAKRGRQIFQSEGCAGCHTPPLYTNNKLLPADGFTVPPEHKLKYDILPMSIGTDPNLTLKTRRGTGYYKVPSLKGVWYRGPFEHSGSVATLEDWFDANRLKDSYVPTGFKGYRVETRAVKGHEFGLQLSPKDKRALIAFLKTL
jgi:mono/diheme cytochrome c family protein